MRTKTEEKPVRLNRIEQMIIDDIREHPGSTQNQVIQRMMGEYCYSYVYNTIKKLQERKRIQITHTKNKSILYIT